MDYRTITLPCHCEILLNFFLYTSWTYTMSSSPRLKQTVNNAKYNPRGYSQKWHKIGHCTTLLRSFFFLPQNNGVRTTFVLTSSGGQVLSSCPQHPGPQYQSPFGTFPVDLKGLVTLTETVKWIASIGYAEDYDILIYQLNYFTVSLLRKVSTFFHILLMVCPPIQCACSTLSSNLATPSYYVFHYIVV